MHAINDLRLRIARLQRQRATSLAGAESAAHEPGVGMDGVPAVIALDHGGAEDHHADPTRVGMGLDARSDLEARCLVRELPAPRRSHTRRIELAWCHAWRLDPRGDEGRAAAEPSELDVAHRVDDIDDAPDLIKNVVAPQRLVRPGCGELDRLW